MKHSAVVIGLGNIGLGYDYDCDDSSVVLTHASGFASHPTFELAAGVDPDPLARSRFENKYHRPAYASTIDLFRDQSPEVVSIAVPTDRHLKMLTNVIGHRPKVILCEKPLATDPAAGEEMLQLSELHHCPVLVNFMRRFEPGVSELKRRIASGELGEIVRGVVWYSKGLLNNGSHYIDLLAYLTGETPQIDSIGARQVISTHEVKADFTLSLGKAEVHFISTGHDHYVLDEIDLVTTCSRIRYEQGGRKIKCFNSSPSRVFAQYRVLDEAETVIPTDLDRYQYYVTDALSRYLEKGEYFASDARTAMMSLRLANLIINQEGGRV